jgi:Carboxypeptidase regulatory-like domain
MKQFQVFTKLCVAIPFLVTALGCGGGSSGTGVPDGFVAKVLTGRVVDESDVPVEDAKITVVETGDTTRTDSSGNFEFEVPKDTDVSLDIEAEGIDATVPVADTPGAETRVDVEISVSRRTGVVNVRNLEVIAKIVGVCDFAFENAPTIRQGNKLKDGTVCPVRVTVRSSYRGLSGIPFRIEKSRCDKEKWKLLNEALTGREGTGTLKFTFRDNDDFCQYRIIAPYNVDGLKNTIHPVHTFRKQAYDRAVKK